MKYCCLNNQRTGSCYFEFQKGRFSGKYWLDHSLLLSADTFDGLNLYRVFVEVVPNFNYYRITEIDKEKWGQVKLTSERIGGAVKAVIDEIDSWVNSVLYNENIITILGI